MEELKAKQVEEKIDPVKEYLKNYKEYKLAEMCAQKDIIISKYIEEKQKLASQLLEIKQANKKHDDVWTSMENLYKEIKNLSVDNYLELYRMFQSDTHKTKVTWSSVSTPLTSGILK